MNISETGFGSMTTNELYWIFSDHLQSSSVILDEDEALLRNPCVPLTGISCSYIGDVTTYYIGGYYELKIGGTTETETKYYTGPTGRFAQADTGRMQP